MFAPTAPGTEMLWCLLWGYEIPCFPDLVTFSLAALEGRCLPASLGSTSFASHRSQNGAVWTHTLCDCVGTVEPLAGARVWASLLQQDTKTRATLAGTAVLLSLWVCLVFFLKGECSGFRGGHSEPKVPVAVSSCPQRTGLILSLTQAKYHQQGFLPLYEEINTGCQ